MILYIFIFIFGALIGSFLNVCIYRIPQGLSIVRPASRCQSCGVPIKFYDNVPILSYMILLGRCRSCGVKLAVRYPVVELLNAVLYIAVFNRFGAGSPWVLLTYFTFVSALIVIFFIDIDHQIIPFSITVPGIVLSIILGATILPDPFLRDELLGFIPSIKGCLIGFGSFYLIGLFGGIIFKKEAMGGGDLYMMAMVGGFLGWKGVFLTAFIGSLIGSIVGIYLIAMKKKDWLSRIPFGPYLAVGALVSLFYGQDILMWYLYA